jgi:hypothetical protein
MNVSTSAFYAWLKKTEKSNDCANSVFDNTLKQIFLNNQQIYGERRIKKQRDYRRAL